MDLFLSMQSKLVYPFERKITIQKAVVDLPKTVVILSDHRLVSGITDNSGILEFVKCGIINLEMLFKQLSTTLQH